MDSALTDARHPIAGYHIPLNSGVQRRNETSRNRDRRILLCIDLDARAAGIPAVGICSVCLQNFHNWVFCEKQIKPAFLLPYAAVLSTIRRSTAWMPPAPPFAPVSSVLLLSRYAGLRIARTDRRIPEPQCVRRPSVFRQNVNQTTINTVSALIETRARGTFSVLWLVQMFIKRNTAA